MPCDSKTQQSKPKRTQLSFRIATYVMQSYVKLVTSIRLKVACVCHSLCVAGIRVLTSTQRLN